MVPGTVTMICAIIAAVAGIVSSFIAFKANKSVASMNNKFLREKESIAFKKKQLSKLYFPMTLNLQTITKTAN